MKIIIKHKGLTALILMACLSLINYSASGQTKKANFAGMWHLNENKSDFGRLTAASAKKVQVLTIDQTANELTIKSGDSTESTKAIIRFDGKPSQLNSNAVINEIPTISRSELSIQWINDHTVTATLDNPKGLMPPSVKTYTISPDLQTFTIDYKLKFGESELTGKLVYDKQKSN
ncbi:hypothetical protein [Mucilaginibacter sp. SG564]|uniref:hypothetical protein n=1 Tax=unclassified Mucilaginibacter TaxID=2617802 RepID=UPI001557F17F|nr:hypothetical protein [Mucilaginibacter sp. SG564]NOW93565.1 hypothetical protein [Mucilaginibacter sp. SG564]